MTDESKGKDKWINKIMYSISLSLFIITISTIIIIASMYFFVVYVSGELGQFVKEVPGYKATLITIGAIAMTYIFRKFK